MLGAICVEPRRRCLPLSLRSIGRAGWKCACIPRPFGERLWGSFHWELGGQGRRPKHKHKNSRGWRSAPSARWAARGCVCSHSSQLWRSRAPTNGSRAPRRRKTPENFLRRMRVGPLKGCSSLLQSSRGGWPRMATNGRAARAHPSRSGGENANPGSAPLAWAVAVTRMAIHSRAHRTVSHLPCDPIICSTRVRWRVRRERITSRTRRMKLPKMSTEEVLTGVFCIAIGGLFLSFAI